MRKATLIALGISLIAGTAMAQDPSGLTPSNAPTRTGNSGPATITGSAPVQSAPMAAPMGSSAAPMASSSSAMPSSSREMRHERRMRHREMRRMRRSADASVDRGAATPDVNRAYMGGGVILEGAPGAPAPMPAPTPPGQRPANMVN
ncbi:hypothetical protein [Roseomonas sp. BN140053]|uniref:hypothetical protein n=1 Tax=Roseomonas sp. BN140053 TaxID=3391898 RepID=UPI0039E9028E